MNTQQIYQQITARILEEMEKGIIPWQKPWTCSGGAVSHISGRPYSMLNQILICIGSDNKAEDLTYGEYLTFKQAKADGGNVRHGEKGKNIVFWTMAHKEKEQEDGTKKTEVYPVLMSYHVFEVSQCDNIKRKFAPEKRQALNPVDDAERIVNTYFDRERCGLRICETDRAYYNPTADIVKVPQISQFDAVAEYYSTLFHEMTHSTGHTSRLNRFVDGSLNFGSDVYSKEELVAEMGAAFLVNQLGIDTQKAFRNSVAYLQNWSRKLRNEPRLFIHSASKAEAAVNFILNGKEETDE